MKYTKKEGRNAGRISKRLREFFLQHGLALSMLSMGVTGISSMGRM